MLNTASLPSATLTTIAIVEAFAKIRELSRVVSQLSETKDESTQKSLMQKGGEIIADFLGKVYLAVMGLVKIGVQSYIGKSLSVFLQHIPTSNCPHLLFLSRQRNRIRLDS